MQQKMVVRNSVRPCSPHYVIIWYSLAMRLEFSYKGHVIRLLSDPREAGWVAKFEIQSQIGEHAFVHMLSDTTQVIHPTLQEANRSAKQLAKTWVDQRSSH
jgi:hypothetical protein